MSTIDEVFPPYKSEHQSKDAQIPDMVLELADREKEIASFETKVKEMGRKMSFLKKIFVVTLVLSLIPISYLFIRENQESSENAVLKKQNLVLLAENQKWNFPIRELSQTELEKIEGSTVQGLLVLYAQNLTIVWNGKNEIFPQELGVISLPQGTSIGNIQGIDIHGSDYLGNNMKLAYCSANSLFASARLSAEARWYSQESQPINCLSF